MSVNKGFYILNEEGGKDSWDIESSAFISRDCVRA